MLKLKIFILSIIILISSIPPSLANEQKVCFHNFLSNYDNSKIDTIEIPIKIGSNSENRIWRYY